VKDGRSSAVGLYATCFYAGGGIGAILPGFAWSTFGWPACVAMVVMMLLLMATVIWFGWRNQSP
jgi:predicted MFS family arabinose efflux permease